MTSLRRSQTLRTFRYVVMQTLVPANDLPGLQLSCRYVSIRQQRGSLPHLCFAWFSSGLSSTACINDRLILPIDTCSRPIDGAVGGIRTHKILVLSQTRMPVPSQRLKRCGNTDFYRNHAMKYQWRPQRWSNQSTSSTSSASPT